MKKNVQTLQKISGTAWYFSHDIFSHWSVKSIVNGIVTFKDCWFQLKAIDFRLLTAKLTIEPTFPLSPFSPDGPGIPYKQESEIKF